jgi:Transcription-repair coupling factor (superfamily II helicase)
MGFEMYNKILEEAVEEARFEEHITDQLNTITRRKIEPQLIVDVDAFIPDDYVSSDTERFDIYKRLSRATSLVEIDELSDEIADRFGKLPPPTANLLTIIKIKINLEALRIPRLEMKGSKISLSLPSNDENFYRSNFPHLMNSLDKMNDLTYRIVQERSEARIEIDFHTSTKYDSAVKLERITRLVEELKNNT